MISNILEKLTVGMDPLDLQMATLYLPTLLRQHLCYIEGKKEALTQQRGYGTKSITVAAVHTVEEEQFSFLLDNRWVNIKAWL